MISRRPLFAAKATARPRRSGLLQALKISDESPPPKGGGFLLQGSL